MKRDSELTGQLRTRNKFLTVRPRTNLHKNSYPLRIVPLAELVDAWTYAGLVYISVISDYVIVYSLIMAFGYRNLINVVAVPTTVFRELTWRLWDERAEKDSAGFVDSKENKWVGSYQSWSKEETARHCQSQEASILWSHHEEREKYDARNNVRCTQAKKTTHGLDGQHQYVNRTPRGRWW